MGDDLYGGSDGPPIRRDGAELAGAFLNVAALNAAAQTQRDRGKLAYVSSGAGSGHYLLSGTTGTVSRFMYAPAAAVTDNSVAYFNGTTGAVLQADGDFTYSEATKEMQIKASEDDPTLWVWNDTPTNGSVGAAYLRTENDAVYYTVGVGTLAAGEFEITRGGTNVALHVASAWSFLDDTTISPGTAVVASAPAGFHQLVVNEDAASGITILSGNASIAGINFGDVDDTTMGKITYDHTTDALALYAGNAVLGLTVESDGGVVLANTQLGFYGATAAVKPTITGSRGANAALASLLTELATLGLLTDSTS